MIKTNITNITTEAFKAEIMGELMQRPDIYTLLHRTIENITILLIVLYCFITITSFYNNQFKNYKIILRDFTITNFLYLAIFSLTYIDFYLTFSTWTLNIIGNSLLFISSLVYGIIIYKNISRFKQEIKLDWRKK